MAFLTDNAVRRRGEDVAIRYCVMCLADGEKVPAVCVIDVGDGDVEAGYCRECAATMKRMGHETKPLPAENRKQWTKLNEAQCRELVNSSDSVPKLARRYGVSEQTVRNTRKKAREQALAAAGVDRPNGLYWQIPKDSGTTAGLDRAGLAAAVAEQGPEAVEEAAEVPDVDVGQDFTYDATIPHPTYYASRIVDGQEIVTEVAPGETEDEAIDRACRQMKERAAPEPPAPVPPFFMPAEEAAEVEFIGAVQSQDLRFREDGTPITNFPAPGTPCEEPVEDAHGLSSPPLTADIATFTAYCRANPFMEEALSVSRNREALLRSLDDSPHLREQEAEEPTFRMPSSDAKILYYIITEEKADRIWATSTLEDKLAFARAELLKRLEAL